MAKPKTDFTNIKCCICDKGNLTSKTAIKGEYISEKFRWKWICQSCYNKDYSKLPNCRNMLRKLVSNVRTGNQDPNSSRAIGDNFQELTCIWRSTVSAVIVEDLNKKLDNYNTPIDHSRDSELGILQTKGCLYNQLDRRWALSFIREHNQIEKGFEFDTLILYCASKDKNIIERIYIIPVEEIINRNSIAVMKNPLKNGKPMIPWYERYRVKDEDELKKVNKIWGKIIL